MNTLYIFNTIFKQELTKETENENGSEHQRDNISWLLYRPDQLESTESPFSLFAPVLINVIKPFDSAQDERE